MCSKYCPWHAVVRIFFPWFLGVMATIIVAQTSVFAAVPQSVATPEATITLLQADSHVDDQTDSIRSVLMGLEFVLEPGWKIYWITPGAGGRPPEMDWRQNSRNIQNLEIAWPFPQRFRTYGLLSNGYADHVILPLWITRTDMSQGLRLEAKVRFFICKDICIPDEVTLAAEIPAGIPQALAERARIEVALASVPKQQPSGMRIVSAQERLGYNGQSRLMLTLQSDEPIAQAEAFFSGEAEFGEPIMHFNSTRTEMRLKTTAQDAAGKTFSVVLKTTDPSGKVVYSHTAPITAQHEQLPWLWLLAVAFAGGLLINVMPCVFPVLMMKILGALSHQNVQPEKGTRQGLHGGFLAMSAGMVTAFSLLGVAFATLRSGGNSLYWGIQFQEPLFLTAMIFVLVFFAAQLLDWWDWHLPRFLSAHSSSHSTAAKGGYVSEFSSGIIATILATPCSAPLVGVTISLAFFANTASMIIILAVMGLGMASPYIVLGSFPVLLRWLPKPGAWMVIVKKILALSVLGTAVWVVWLLSRQVDISGAASISAMAALVLFSLSMGKFPETKIASHRVKLAALVALFGLLMVPRFVPLQVQENRLEGWQEFAPDRIVWHLEQGKTVLVVVSADWCLSCLVNDQWVFNQPEVRQWRQSADVVAMRGDWSQPDESIREFLARFDRQALPFAILFTPSAPEGMLLSELLTMQKFRQALQQVAAAKLPAMAEGEGMQ